jgi:hypothetical protein
MKNELCLLLVASSWALGGHALGCTNFVASRNGVTLFGNNADFVDPDANVWFVPASPSKYGRAYFGYALGFPMGGMNDQGLVFECPATATRLSDRPQTKPIYPGNLLEKALEECATVDEVLGLFGRYDLHWICAFQIIVADAAGNSAIVEGDEVVRKRGDFQIATNFRQSLHEENPYSIDRYAKAEAMLANASEISIELFRSILAATHQEPGEGQSSPTQYSRICDLKTGDICLYLFHNYLEVARINLADELRKGPHHLPVQTLFTSTSCAFDAYCKATQFPVPVPVKVDATVLQDLVGEYVADPLVRFLGFTITLEEGRLYGRIRGFDPYELIPESDSTYYFRELKSHYAFVRGSDGQVRSLVFDLYGIEKAPARRVR